MNLLNLIPAVQSLAEPVSHVLGDGSSGLTEIVGRLENQDLGGSVAFLSDQMGTSLSEAIPDQDASPVSGAVGLLGDLSSLTDVPTDLFAGLEGPLSELETVSQRVPQILDLLTALVDALGDLRRGDLSTVVDQAVQGLSTLLGTVTGPDFAGFDDWLDYVREVGESIRPVIDAGGDPDMIRDQLLTMAFERVRQTIFSLAPDIVSLRDEAEGLFDGLLADASGFNLEALSGDVSAALEDLAAQAAIGGDLNALIADYQAKTVLLTDQLHLALDEVQAVSGHALLTPGGLAESARSELATIMAMQVDDYSNVIERLEAFFDGIEQAVDGVDLSGVSDGITTFFDQIQSAVSDTGLGQIEEEINGIRGDIGDLLVRVEEMIVALTARVQGWLGELTASVGGAVATLGETGPDGRFHFAFEAHLEELYGRMDALIEGDPARPQDFSIAGALNSFQDGFLELIGTIEAQLTDLANELEGAKENLAGSLESVRTEIEAVDPQAIMEQAAAALDDAFQAIGGLEFDPIVDPIIAELEEARDSLAQIDLSSLNDLLKAALSAALDAIQTSDFDREITDVLLDELDDLLAYPREVLATIAEKINALVDKVTAISPERLFEPVQAQVDRLTDVLDVDLGAVLKPPLQSAVDQLVDVLEQLNPTQFLEPLQSAYQKTVGAVDQLDPGTLLEPLQAQIEGVAQEIATLDLSAPLGHVNAAFGDMNAFLDGLNPAVLLAPVTEPFERASTILASLAPSQLLAPLTDVMDQIGDLTQAIPDTLVEEIQALYDQALARVDSLDPSVLFNTVRGPYEAFYQRFDALRPAGVLTQIQQVFTQTRNAVAAADARDGTAFAIQCDAAAPTVMFASVISRHEPLQSRLQGVLEALDPSDLQAQYDQARARMEELLPRALRDTISASQLQVLLDMTDPAGWIARLDAIYNRILDKINSLNPIVLMTPLSDTYQTVREVLGAVDIGRITQEVQEILDDLGRIVEGISLEAIFDPVLAMVDQLRSMVAGLDPSLLTEGLNDRFAQIIALLEAIAVDGLVDALHAAWDRIRALIEELFDLENLLAPLVEIFDAVTTLLGGLDAGVLVAGIDDKLNKVHDELEEALARTGTAFKEMLAAVPVNGGSASAAVSL